MAIALVNHGSNVNNATSVNTLAASALNVSSGNLLVVLARSGGSPTITVSDTASNTFTQIGSTVSNGGIGNVAMFYAKNVTGNASDVITANFSTSNQFTGIAIVQYSGADTSAPLDVNISANIGSNTSAPATGTFTTTNANDVIVVGFTANSVSETYTAGTGYTMEENNAAFGGIEDQLVSSIQTNITASLSSSGSHQWVLFAAAFKAAAGGGGASVTYPQLERGIRGLNRGLAITRKGGVIPMRRPVLQRPGLVDRFGAPLRRAA